MSAQFDYAARIERLREIKTEQTAKKRVQQGPRDSDDHGQIPLDAPLPFRPQSDDSRGYILGAKDCGRNFARYLDCMPAYVNKYSSLMGGYYGQFIGCAAKWDPEDYWTQLAPEHKEYNIIHGIMNSQHFSADLSIGLALGYGGLLEKINDYAGRRECLTPGFDQGLLSVVTGIQDWIKKHILRARELLEDETDAQIAQNLRAMIRANEAIVGGAPKTFHEACQWIAWYQMACRAYNGSGALGALDMLLYPFYARDRAAGILDDEEAVFHLCCLNLSDPQYIQVGGVDENGNDTTNALSFLILEAAHRLRIPANIAVAVYEGMDEALYDRAVELLIRDRIGVPRFFGLDSTVRGFVNNNVPLQDARARVQTGCHWSSIPGREYSFSDVIKINFAKVFECAFYDLMLAGEDASVQRLWEGFHAHLKKAVLATARGIDLHMAKKHLYFPELPLSLLCHGTIEKGLDASAGALEYNTICVDGAALATAADSFNALETLIEKQKALTWKEVFMAVDRNFLLHGDIRARLLNVPGFGRPESAGNGWAKRITGLFAQLVAGEPTPDGYAMVPGLFSWASTLPMGKAVGATPNGRLAMEPISFGANPDPGPFHGGPLTPVDIARAVASVQCGYGNAVPMQLDIDYGTAGGQEGKQCLKALLRAHMRMGGTLININILDGRKIREAYEKPGTHPDLIVRVTGFSAYFASLSDGFRKLVYERMIRLEEEG